LKIFDPLNQLFVQFFQFLHTAVAGVIPDKNFSYGIAIILMTAIIKLILLPLNYKQTISMLRMNDIQPEVKKLQDKYKGDPQKSQQEMMKLYKEKGVNPMGGCLPMLIQWPILIALYYVFNSLKGINGVHFLWITDLGAHATVGNVLSWILPLLAGATTYLAGKLTTATGDSAQAKQASTMNVAMSVFLIVMSWNLSAALVLYWVIGNLFQAGQTIFFKKIKERHSDVAKV